MYMNVHPETWLRNKADTPTIKMLDLWHSLCTEKVGTPIEVMVTNRREYPYHNINTYNGKMNTAIPQPLGDRLILVLLLESVEKLDMIIVTHELGHWVLKLKGLKVMANYSDSGYLELSSLCSHPALYVLQRSIRHDPQKEIDRRVAHDIAFLPRKIETSDEKTNTEKALYYADDIINCSRSNRTGLERILSQKLPKTAKLVEKILEIKLTRDISKIEEILPFSRELVQKLELKGNWSESNDLGRLREQIAELRLKK